MTGFSFICFIIFYNISSFESFSAIPDSDVLQNNEDKVEIKVFYESLCPYCRKFMERELGPLIDSVGSRIDLYLHPFGNAKVNYTNGKFSLKCQHGVAECYGNKLHACALDRLGTLKAFRFNNCLMSFNRSQKGSDDAALKICDKSLSTSSDAVNIKTCANTFEGDILHLFHGIETAKAKHKHVPHVLINGTFHDVNKGFEPLKKFVCAALKKPPMECFKINSTSIGTTLPV